MKNAIPLILVVAVIALLVAWRMGAFSAPLHQCWPGGPHVSFACAK